ncbi:putative pentatricopeptide repeat-containing protein At3g23330 [Gastrolobium bilobum]|uniref:putative pentatricopeptide repeat-containing protein At3g23330 n=1 Tax=Gastrolobium bilobum TaxID=150636 RepID=UPI002AB1D5D7|nr:putative pentatricopeptide repeat-containing protein At3g23330 [Gastrolobium bilobum]
MGLKACGDLLVYELGRKVHALVLVDGLESDIYVGNSLLSMYSMFGDMETARMLFDKMPVRDLTSWNIVISGHVKNGEAVDAFEVFDSMRRVGVVGDGTTLLALLCACGDIMDLKLGKAVHGYVVRNSGKLCNEFLTNSLIDMYCNCGSISGARKLFEELKVRDTVSWNSFKVMKLFSQMFIGGGIPNEVNVIAVFAGLWVPILHINWVTYQILSVHCELPDVVIVK